MADKDRHAKLKREPAFTSEQAARILFGDQYVQYIHWQRTIGDLNQIQYFGDRELWELVRDSVSKVVHGQLPTAWHFKSFMNWLRSRGLLFPTQEPRPISTFAVASKCGHALHPGNPCQRTETCPVCVVEQCTGSLSRIWEAWHRLGAPWEPEDPDDGDNDASEDEEENNAGDVEKARHPRTDEVRVLYARLKRIWRVEKGRWANLMNNYAKLAESEQTWEEQEMAGSPYAPKHVQRSKSCMMALHIARAKCPGIADGGDVAFQPSMKAINSPPWIPDSPEYLLEDAPTSSCISPAVFGGLASPTSPSPPPPPSISTLPSRSIYSKKKVQFSIDIIEFPSRRLGAFHRGSPSYKRGRHACPSKHGWEDTSFMNEPFYDLLMEFDLQHDYGDYGALSFDEKWTIIKDELDHYDIDGTESDDSDSDSDTSCTSLVMGENDRRALRKDRLCEIPKEIEEKSESIEDSDSNENEFDDDEVKNAKIRLSKIVPDSSAVTENTRSFIVRTAVDDKTNCEKKGKALHSPLGPRSREDFEANLLSTTERKATEVKRPRRGST